MPMPINLSAYPVSMLDLLEVLVERKEDIPVDFPDAKTAKHEQLRWYGLKKAITLAEHSLAPHMRNIKVSRRDGEAKITLKWYDIEKEDPYGKIAKSLTGS
jgi:hypothetical protein